MEVFVYYRILRFDALWDTTQWITPAYVALDSKGMIAAVSTTPAHDQPAERIAGFALPGYHNAHSHAFQYAMAGLAEHLPTHALEDDFWTWRETMYRLALTVSPDAMEDIAAMLYAQMAACGYTSVAEFHYLHHDTNGYPYENKAEMGQRLIAAAARAGIKITLIPTFYQRGGFGKPAQPQQRRFVSASVEDFFDLLESSRTAVSSADHARLGVAVHSLRAATAEDAQTIFSQADPTLIRHIHASEQQKEVDDCLAHLGERPVAWLLQHLPLDARYHLIHATHILDEEARALAQSGAHVVLCPSTEGNLGDGFFPLRTFMEASGRWSIGTDSHIGIDLCEELRWMDYVQRLRRQKRNRLCIHGDQDSGQIALQYAIQNGRAANGHTAPPFAIGQPLDAVVYDAHHPLLAAAPSERRLSTIVYASDACARLGTLVNGQWIVHHRQHRHQDALRTAFLRTLHSLQA